MDTVALVDVQIRDGEEILFRLAEEGFPLQAAGWVKPTEKDRWSLYLVTPLFVERGPLDAYRQVLAHLRPLVLQAVTGTDLKLVDEGHPVGQCLLDATGRRYDGHVPGLLLSRLKGAPVDDMYVYPQPASESAEEQLCILVAYVYRREPRAGAKRWHRDCRKIEPSPIRRRPGRLRDVENTPRQVTLVFAVPCDEHGELASETREEYENRADEAFASLRPGEVLA